MAEAPKVADGGDDLVFAETTSAEVINSLDSGVSLSPLVVTTGYPFNPLKQKADTARNIAYALVAILGTSVLLHYLVISLTPLPEKSELRLKAYEAAFNAWLPVASGLVSAAVTYYFTRDRDDKK